MKVHIDRLLRDHPSPIHAERMVEVRAEGLVVGITAPQTGVVEVRVGSDPREKPLALRVLYQSMSGDEVTTAIAGDPE